MINDRYKIKKKLGSGRSQVYVCSDKYNNSKNIALKVLSSPAGNQDVESFRNEFFLLKKLNHPNIIKVYDYGTMVTLDSEDTLGTEITLGSKFFTLDYIEGRTLDEFDDSGDPNNLFEIISQVCSALYYLHQSNFIYYNLIPENIIIQESDRGQHIYFSNFRLAKYIPDNEPFEVHSTPHYIAPEILQLKSVDHRADLYSLGIILYKLIYKRFPFDTDDELNIYKANIEQEFEFPDKKNYSKLIDITKVLLRKSPADRFKISLQILEELQIPFSGEMKNQWKPVKTFCGRKKELYDINSVIYNKKAKEIISIRGGDGTGKSLFLEKLSHTHTNSILIKHSDILYNDRFWKVLLRNIFYLESISKNIDDNSKNEIIDLLSAKSNDLTEKLKSLFLRISRENKFVLLLDDFNLYDELSIEILKEITEF